MPLSTSVHATPAISSTVLPVGNNAPQLLSGDVVEVEPDRCRGAGDAGQRRVAMIDQSAVAHGETRRGDRVGVEHVNADAGFAVVAFQQPPFEGERSHAGEKVAAVLAIGDESVADAELEEQVVEVGAIDVGVGDDRHLAR